ncbi:histidine triad nucleotide-binding protein [Phytomonospora sp. NPDC050363]|uniref:histidine triad nucleotide-binding protein n=1 Tax=Phytomonospora sp. NPDC050363 TaxID=3155642 RepID=UPI0033CFE40C
MADCLFCRIVAGEIPSATVHETNRVLVFRDIAPKAPTHLLAIPKDHHVTVAELAAADPGLAGELLEAAGRAAESEGLDGGYRLIVNTGDDSGWEVRHVHVHVLGGEPLGPLLAR